MLKLLSISNLAVIDNIRIDFGPGLNVLTGETGSGKSIIVDALSLLLGDRGQIAQIRTGEKTASVEGIFETSGRTTDRIAAILREVGCDDLADEEIIIRREVSSGSKGRVFINDRSVTVATLRALQPSLVEIYGQGEQRSLQTPASHLWFLDSFGGHGCLRASVRDAFETVRKTQRDLEGLIRDSRDGDKSAEFVRHQLAEIDTIQPRAGEDMELLYEKSVLAHAERVLMLSRGAYARLYELDDSALSQIGLVRRQLEELATLDSRVMPLLETLKEGVASLADVADTLRGYGARLDFSPTRLAEIEERLASLERLKRKYMTDLQGILNVRDELAQKLEGLSDLEARIQALIDLARVARSEYVEQAKELSARRTKAARRLEEETRLGLQQVAMQSARILVQIDTPKLKEGNQLPEMDDLETDYFRASGADKVEFLLAANEGEGPRRLAQAASGGELSRLMLTLRTLNLGTDHADDLVETVVFDEIDVGIGGQVAEVVGKRLKSLASNLQVLCVTHQPQIARFADQHYVVDKSVRSGRTVTSVSALSSEGRVEELARMIGGSDRGSKTLEAARWLLAKGTDGDIAPPPDSKPRRRARSL
jgi:DNA repair protein RecN (Recombination protein N)